MYEIQIGKTPAVAVVEESPNNANLLITSLIMRTESLKVGGVDMSNGMISNLNKSELSTHVKWSFISLP